MIREEAIASDPDRQRGGVNDNGPDQSSASDVGPTSADACAMLFGREISLVTDAPISPRLRSRHLCRIFAMVDRGNIVVVGLLC